MCVYVCVRMYMCLFKSICAYESGSRRTISMGEIERKIKRNSNKENEKEKKGFQTALLVPPYH